MPTRCTSRRVSGTHNECGRLDIFCCSNLCEPPKITIFNGRSYMVIIDAPMNLKVRTCAVYKYPFKFTEGQLLKESNNWNAVLDFLKTEMSKVFKL